MRLIDNELGGTTPMDIIIRFKDTELISENDEFEDLLGDEEDYRESNWFTTDKVEKINQTTRLNDLALFVPSLPRSKRHGPLARRIGVSLIITNDELLITSI